MGAQAPHRIPLFCQFEGSFVLGVALKFDLMYLTLCLQYTIIKIESLLNFQQKARFL